MKSLATRDGNITTCRCSISERPVVSLLAELSLPSEESIRRDRLGYDRTRGVRDG